LACALRLRTGEQFSRAISRPIDFPPVTNSRDRQLPKTGWPGSVRRLAQGGGAVNSAVQRRFQNAIWA
jgi:hypothetical protein